MQEIIERYKKQRQVLGEAFLENARVGTYLMGHTAAVDAAVKSMAAALSLSPEWAIVAVGGYGRKELFPFSDIDVMVLTDQAPDEVQTETIERFVTALWDLGLTVGHSVRTLDSALSEAQKDITVQTAILEARLITGNGLLFAELQKAFFNEHITREIPFRLCALDRLAEGIASRDGQLSAALRADLGKSPFESYATETGFLLHEIRTFKNNLQRWARDRRRPTPMFLFGAKSRIHYEPSGCVLIIAPWNYPLQLALSPLVGAIAAGN